MLVYANWERSTNQNVLDVECWTLEAALSSITSPSCIGTDTRALFQCYELFACWVNKPSSSVAHSAKQIHIFSVSNIFIVKVCHYTHTCANIHLWGRFIAERCEHSERSEANNRVLFEIPRYLYIYTNIYVSVASRNRRLAHIAIIGKWRP